MSDKRRASVERIAGAQLASMNGTMADAVGQSNRQRMVWLSLLAMPLLFPVALPGMASIVGAFCILVAFGLFSGQPVPLPAWLARREINGRARALLARMISRVVNVIAALGRPRLLRLSDRPARVVRCPTRLVWLLGRALVGGVSDAPDARTFADGVRLEGSGPRPSCVRLWQDSGNAAQDFFANLIQAVDEIGVPSGASDLRPLMRSLRLPPGGLDALERSSERVHEGLRQAHTEGMHLIEQHIVNLTRKPWTWSPHLGVWSDNILMRATVAMKGLGALAATETIYAQADFDADSEPLHGQHGYTLRFENGHMPPADAFWSVSLYGEDRYFAANPMGRYAIGDRTQSLQLSQDNSLTLQIQHERPAEGDANWLPAPSGPFYLILRMYHPREEMLKGRYALPPVQRIKER